MKRTFLKLIIAMLVVCLLVAGTGCDSIFNKNTGGTGLNNVIVGTGDYPVPSGDGTSSVISGTKLYSLVTINTVSGEKTRYNSCADLDDAVGKSVVMIENIRSSGTALGAGIVLDVDVKKADGSLDNGIYVVTCAHVVNSAVKIRVKFSDNNYNYDTYSIIANIGDCLIGSDAISDIAVLRFDIADASGGFTTDKLVKAKMRDVDTDPLRRGDEVYAIGNPDGSEGWASNGIISKFDNRIYLYEIGTMMELMGTTAPINAGNSGGGLFNMYGELVGMVNAGNSSLENFAYAVPVATTEDKDGELDLGLWYTVTQLISNKRDVTYGFVSGRISTSAFFMASSSNGYAYVYSLNKNGVLEQAGLQVNDYIIGFIFGGKHNGNTVEGGSADFSKSSTPYKSFFEALYKLQSELKEDDPVSLTIHVKRAQVSGDYFNTIITYKDYSFNITDFAQYIYSPAS